MKKIIVYIVFLVLTTSITAQETNSNSWNMILHLKAGYSLATSDWEYTHPYHLGSGSTFTGSISGTFEESSIFSCGFEYSKSYLGFEANVGIFPAKFLIKKQVDPGITQMRDDVYSFNCIILEAEGILFPIGNPKDKITPFIKVGLGGMKTTGDINNNLLSISGVTGARIFISDKFGVDFSLRFRYMLLYDVVLTNEISAAYGVPISSLIANAGILYRL